MKAENIVHLAGKADRKGLQLCGWCGETITEWPFTPFEQGALVRRRSDGVCGSWTVEREANTSELCKLP